MTDERDDYGERRYHLTMGLIGPDYKSLYDTSMMFRSAIDTLVAMLPWMVDGLATQAQSEEQQRQEALHKMMRDTMMTQTFDPADFPGGFKP